ncbi:2-hydroxychromene-2-carboxylate isomerase [Azospirillum sp. ST 5-10]|uniref:2-hydroxychromene-2-carboxylate isomerase n=1 Tax=unclassified Azospirillum TaxID=2630922 RepID=UPI003F4A2FA9
MADAIDFYFDFASPYGYFASLQIDALAARHGRTVCWRPILLGAVFKITGMRPNMEQPLRGEYLAHDSGRIARMLGCPFRFPDVMPVRALNPSRAFWWLNGRSEAQARRLAAALYHAHWGEGRDIGPAETVAEVAGDQGLDPAEVTAALQDQAVKDRLRAETDQAIARGVFGSPFVIVDDEPFWGWDRLPMVERWLSTGGW